MPQAIISRNDLQIPIETAVEIKLDSATNIGTIGVKMFDGQWIYSPIFCGTAWAAMGPTKKAGVAEALDTLTALTLTEVMGVSWTVAQVRAAGLGYNIEAAPPVEE